MKQHAKHFSITLLVYNKNKKGCPLDSLYTIYIITILDNFNIYRI